MNYIDNLPDELSHLIYKQYFSKYIIPEFNKQICRNRIPIGNGKSISCGMRCYDSSTCWACMSGTIEYYNY